MMNLEATQEPEGQAPRVLDISELVVQNLKREPAKAGEATD